MSGQLFFFFSPVSEVDVGAAAVVFAHSCVASLAEPQQIKEKQKQTKTISNRKSRESSGSLQPLNPYRDAQPDPQKSLKTGLLLAPPVIV